jgi:hypothetical protein
MELYDHTPDIEIVALIAEGVLSVCRFLHPVTPDGELDWARHSPSRPKLAGKVIGGAAPLDCMCTRPNKPPFGTHRGDVEYLPRIAGDDYACLLRVGILDYQRRQSHDITDSAEAGGKDNAGLRMNKGRPAPEHPPAFLRQSFVKFPHVLDDVGMSAKAIVRIIDLFEGLTERRGWFDRPSGNTLHDLLHTHLDLRGRCMWQGAGQQLPGALLADFLRFEECNWSPIARIAFRHATVTVVFWHANQL